MLTAIKLVLLVIVLHIGYHMVVVCFRSRQQNLAVDDFWPALQVVVLCLIGLALTGCASVRPDGGGTEIKHDSVLLKGEPFTDRTNASGQKVEDSLDVWNNYLFWDRPGFYAEIGVGVKVREGGFYDDGSPIIFNARFGKRFKFGER